MKDKKSENHKKRMSPAQQDSGISNLGILGILGSLGILGGKAKTAPAQQDSRISNLAEAVKTSPAQRHSKMSNRGMGLIGPMGHIGLMGRKPVNKNRPAQRSSEISNLGVLGILRSLGILGGKAKNENAPAQRYSKMSILNDVNDEIITIQVENKMGFLAWGWDYEKQNAPAQRYSKMSILKIETENGSPQRYSKMSNGRLSGLLCWPHGQRAMFTVRIKNIVNAMGVMRIMRIMGIMGQKHKNETSSAQRDSGNAILKKPSVVSVLSVGFQNQSRSTGLFCKCGI